MGEDLLAAGAFTPTTYQELLSAEAAGASGLEVFSRCGLDPAGLDEALQSVLKRTIFEMFDWDEGAFSFVLDDHPDPWRDFRLTDTRAVARQGLNPQYLAIEGARVRDERAKEDSLESFLRQRDAPARPRTLDVETFAARLRSSQQPGTSGPSSPRARETVEKVIPFPSARSRRDSKPTSAPAVTSSAQEDDGAGASSGGAAASAAGEAAVADAASTAPSSDRRMLVIDDDPQVTQQVASALGGRVARLVVANTVADALPHIEAAAPGWVVVSDLIIARSDGKGILGGIEVLERVRGVSADVPVILFSDYENAEAEQRARKLGITAFLMKPRKAQIQAAKGAASPPMRAFLGRLTEALGDLLAEPGAAPASAPPGAAGGDSPTQPPAASGEGSTGASGPPAPPRAPESGRQPEPTDASATSRREQSVEPGSSYDLRREITSDLPDLDLLDAADLPPAAAVSGPIGALRSMLTELIDPANRDTITLLVLRFASNVLERAGLFLVTRRAFVGLGGFSVDQSSDRFVAQVRKIQIPGDRASIFDRICKYKAPIRGTLPHSEGNEMLIGGMGGGWPGGDAIAMPIVSSDRVAAILYGDNPSGKDLGPTETLEIFLQQAGLAMDRALLERKLEESRRKRGE